MPTKNGLVKFTGSELMDVLSELEYMLISLRNIGDYYYMGSFQPDEKTPLAYALETTRFLDESNIDQRLDKIKHILLQPMIREPGTNNARKLKRNLKRIDCWQKPGD
jgi:hypothetical protein